jgi:DNA-binding MarR family transcriptional regulator
MTAQTTQAPSASGDVVRLYRALSRITRSVRRGARGAEIGHGALSALATLVSEDAQRIGSLAEAAGVSPPAMSRLVNHLEEHGLVVRRPDPSDGRASVVEATDAGRDVVLSGRAERLRVLQARCAALSPDDRQRLLAALPVLEALGAEG